MATVATSYVVITFSGDVNGSTRYADAVNADSPAQLELIDLDEGANVITVPTGGAFASVLIVPPDDNELSITFKGVLGDEGVRLHDTNPSKIGLDSSVEGFVLTAEDAIENVRLIWT